MIKIPDSVGLAGNEILQMMFDDKYAFPEFVPRNPFKAKCRDLKFARVPSASERRGKNLKRFKDFHLQDKARIWP